MVSRNYELASYYSYGMQPRMQAVQDMSKISKHYVKGRYSNAVRRPCMAVLHHCLLYWLLSLEYYNIREIQIILKFQNISVKPRDNSEKKPDLFHTENFTESINFTEQFCVSVE